MQIKVVLLTSVAEFLLLPMRKGKWSVGALGKILGLLWWTCKIVILGNDI